MGVEAFEFCFCLQAQAVGENRVGHCLHIVRSHERAALEERPDAAHAEQSCSATRRHTDAHRGGGAGGSDQVNHVGQHRGRNLDACGALACGEDISGVGDRMQVSGGKVARVEAVLVAQKNIELFIA